MAKIAIISGLIKADKSIKQNELPAHYYLPGGRPEAT
jgi:hypothetical protein